MKRMKIKEGVGTKIGRSIIRIILFVWAIMIVFPFIWVFYTSFKSNKEFYADVWALPEVLRFENYKFAWTTAQFAEYFMNSLFVVVVSVIISVLITSSTAYVLAKYRYRWLKVVRRFYLIMMAVPAVLVLVPQYFMFLNMGLTNNLLVLSVLYALGAVPLQTFMVIGFLSSVDNALLEAADIDGANEFQKFFQIVIPTIKPALFVTILNRVLGSWNEYIMALTFLDDENKFTVPIGLSYLQGQSQYSVEYGGLFAGLIIAMIPIIIVYSLFQKQLQEGVRMDGGVKG